MFLVALPLSGQKIGVDQRSQENTFLATKKKGCMASGPSENRSLSKTFIDRYHSKDEIKNLWQNPLLCMIMYLRVMFSVIPKKGVNSIHLGLSKVVFLEIHPFSEKVASLREAIL